MRMYIVYWIRREHHVDINTQGYVGITSCGLPQRLYEHRYTNTIVSKAIHKYDDIVTEVVHERLTKEQAAAIEFSLRPKERIGWNICPGGGIPPSRVGKKVSLETRIKLSEIRRGKVKSKEHIQKISEALRGKPPGNAGTKRKIVTCPHCNKAGGINTMTQWHFDKCKYRRS